MIKIVPRNLTGDTVQSIKSLWLIVTAWLFFGLSEGAVGMYHSKGFGEPYELAARRMVFTTWYWVRPGQQDWRDDQGKSVFADKSVMAGPYDSHFIDIDGPYGIRLVAEPAQRGFFDIQPTEPWEAGGVYPIQLLQADGKIMAWCKCKNKDGVERDCYLESTDGITWNRPKLNMVDYDGSKENNLTDGNPPGIVFIDPNGPGEERFKAASNSSFTPEEFDKYKQRRPYSVMATETDPGRVHAIFGYTSPDGLHWNRLPNPLTVEVSDGDQIVYYDPRLKRYVMYSRTYYVGPRAEGYPNKHERWHGFMHRRAIGRAETPNFREFPFSEVVIETSNDMAPSDTFYLNCRTSIPGAPDHHVMFPSRYIQSEDKTAMDLYTSYDGKAWHLAPGSPLLKTSDFGEWDGGCVFVYPNLVERGDGSWVLPYRGDLFPHKYPRGKQASRWGMIQWPKGRLMALEAQDLGGFTTPAFLPPGSRMKINALTSRVGEIRVEAADFYGKTLPGRSFEECIPIVGDQYQTPVRWKGAEDLGVSPGDPVVLRFRMKKAKIYALDFE